MGAGCGRGAPGSLLALTLRPKSRTGVPTVPVLYTEFLLGSSSQQPLWESITIGVKLNFGSIGMGALWGQRTGLVTEGEVQGKFLGQKLQWDLAGALGADEKLVSSTGMGCGQGVVSVRDP